MRSCFGKIWCHACKPGTYFLKKSTSKPRFAFKSAKWVWKIEKNVLFNLHALSWDQINNYYHSHVWWLGRSNLNSRAPTICKPSIQGQTCQLTSPVSVQKYADSISFQHSEWILQGNCTKWLEQSLMIGGGSPLMQDFYKIVIPDPK